MKKLLALVLAVAFAAGLLAGIGTPSAKAAFCYFTCSCEGIPLKCCITPYGTVCKPTTGFECPQRYDC
jgi:hypothetical protein